MFSLDTLLPSESEILTFKEEQKLGKQIQSKTTTQRTKRKAVEKLIMHNIRFAIYEAKKIRPNDEDLAQIHIIALHEAAWKYKPNMGSKFITYARWWMRTRRNSYFCKFSRQVSLPLRYIESGFKPFPSETSLNSCIGDTGTERINEFNSDSGIPNLNDQLQASSVNIEFDHPSMISSVHKLILDKVYQLPETKRKVMLAYIAGEDNISKIGRQVGKTRERARQIKAEVFAQLRISLEPHKDIVSELLAT